MPRKITYNIEIETRWYKFINSLPEPTMFFPDYAWGKHLKTIQPNIPPYIEYSYCDIRYWLNKHGRAIVLLSQDDDNPSTSITNAYEHIATAFIHQQRLDPHNITWFESYSCYTHGDNDLSFSEIKFTCSPNGLLHSPKWKWYSKEDFKAELSLPF